MTQPSQIEDFKTFSSKTGLKKVNRYAQAIRELLVEVERLKHRTKDSPRILYIQTDSVAEAIVVNARQVEWIADDQIVSPGFDAIEPV